MRPADKELLLEVAHRLRGEAIRREHDMAEAHIAGNWFMKSQHAKMADKLHEQAKALDRAAASQ